MDPFVAEVRIFPFNFAPKGWAACDGQLLAISQNTALFSLLGTNFGGDGKSNFALPNIQGGAPMHVGNGQGLTPRVIGESGGEDTVTLTTQQIPAHSHFMRAHNQDPADVQVPSSNTVLAQSTQGNAYNTSTTGLTQLANTAISPNGSSAAHNNRQPYLTLNFCIAMQGVFPQRP